MSRKWSLTASFKAQVSYNLSTLLLFWLTEGGKVNPQIYFNRKCFFFDNRNGSKKGESVDHNIDIAFDKIFLILYIFKTTYLSKWRLLDTMWSSVLSCLVLMSHYRKSPFLGTFSVYWLFQLRKQKELYRTYFGNQFGRFTNIRDTFSLINSLYSTMKVFWISPK